ncbi:MAG: hypothetical protein JWQ44_1365 [Chthoniobacter sp.]|jgi:ADP-heptose:LPS heptosyltransferase|nr:hypothetical protein [Chthoniobacter sp.]
MRILALQLKRIGDLILTTPALRLLRETCPEAHIALAVNDGCRALLPAIDSVDSTIVFGPKRGFAPWQQVIAGGWDLCVDFTGSDRSAFATALSRAKCRATFSSVRRQRLRALAYNRSADSAVRERHTVDHYLDLAKAVVENHKEPLGEAQPHLSIPDDASTAALGLLRTRGVTGPFALLHPGTARAEKFWTAEGWTVLQRRLSDRPDLACVLTGGSDSYELEHVARIAARSAGRALNLAGQIDLLTLAALAERARIVISCDTAMVHLAAAFGTPQVALYGPTNPFHWRPRHARAVVLSSAQPDAPLTEFAPRMRGAPMEALSTEAVVRATEGLLARTAL